MKQKPKVTTKKELEHVGGLIKPDMAPEPISRLTDGINTPFVAMEMARIDVENQKKKSEHAAKKLDLRKILIDDHYRYYITLPQFKVDLSTKFKKGDHSQAYLAYLNDCQQKYGDAAAFYNSYCESKADESLHSGYCEIYDFIASEILNFSVSSSGMEAGLQYLDEVFLGLFKSVEGKIVKAEGPMSSQTKIRLAAFVETLFEKKWFVSKKNRVKTSNDFSSARYGIDVEIQLSSDKKSDRESNKSQLKKYF